MFVFVISFFCIYLIDLKINSILIPYINVEVERLVNNVVNNAIDEEIKNVEISKLLIDSFDKEKNISYNTVEMNKIEAKIDKRIQKELINIDDGIIPEYFIPNRIKSGRFKNVKSGVLCDISIGSIRGSTLFANVGPTIPIKLLFSSELNSDISIDISEYGINNAIIKIYFITEVNEQITMPLTSKRKKVSIKRPISVDIIRGKIPEYYNGFLK